MLESGVAFAVGFVIVAVVGAVVTELTGDAGAGMLAGFLLMALGIAWLWPVEFGLKASPRR